MVSSNAGCMADGRLRRPRPGATGDRGPGRRGGRAGTEPEPGPGPGPPLGLYDVILDRQGYMIDPETYRGRQKAQLAPKTRVGDAGFGDLAGSSAWAQSDFSGGFGYPEWDPEHPTRFADGTAIDISYGDLRPGRALSLVAGSPGAHRALRHPQGGALRRAGLFVHDRHEPGCRSRRRSASRVSGSRAPACSGVPHPPGRWSRGMGRAGRPEPSAWRAQPASPLAFN